MVLASAAPVPGTAGEGAPARARLAVAALLFAAGSAATLAWTLSMPAFGTPMPGGWSLSMAWTRLCAGDGVEAAATFVGMWSVMMLPMMLPAIWPLLRDWPGRLAVAAGAGYFLVWSLAGALAYPLGLALADLAMERPGFSRAVPALSALALLLAGLVQFTGWKARRLAACVGCPGGRVAETLPAAVRQGLRLALRCGACCGNLMALLLLLGAMDLAVMALATAAIAAERRLPAGRQAAGIAALAAGLLLLGRALAEG